MHEFLSDRDDAADNPLGRLDVRVKLIAALAAILAVVASSRVVLPLAVFAACLAASFAWRTGARRMLWRLAAPLGLAVAVCLLRAFMTGSTAVLTFSIGGWRLTATREGFIAGALIGARVLGSVSAVLLLCACTPAHTIFAALRWAKAPRSLVEIAMLMHRHVFTLFEQAASVVAAQKVRLGYSGLRRGIGSMASLAGIVALRSIDQADKTHEAMVARGFRGSLPIPPLAPLSRKSMLLLAGFLSVLGAAYVLAERWVL